MNPNLRLRFFQVICTETDQDGNRLQDTYWVERRAGNQVDAFTDDLAEAVLTLLNKRSDFRVEEANELKTEDSDGLEILVAILDNQMLRDPMLFEELLDDSRELRRITDSVSRQLDSQYTPRPMLTIGVDSLMEGHLEAEHSLSQHIRQHIDARFRFLDCSIWHRYIALNSPEEFEIRLVSVLEELISYYEKGLYDTIVAQEYLEFQCRKLRESYIHSLSGGHAKRVTPFRFHSESDMKTKADALLDKVLGPYTWSYLLVDDYERHVLRPVPSAGTKSINRIITKDELIFGLLNQNSKKVEPVVKKRRAENGFRPANGYLSDGILRLQKSRPDIIILDYFFGMGETNPNEQYGHKFISRLRTRDKRMIENIGVENMIGGKFWIFPISGFEDAFRSHLRTMGESMGSNDLEIADGADPVNTPHLFRYLFYQFLQTQKLAVGVNLADMVISMRAELAPDGKNIKEVLTSRYAEITALNSRLYDLNQAAANERRYQGDGEQDHISYSLFAKSYIEIIDRGQVLKDLCLHLQNLAYFIAFGSGLDWAKMWKSYQFIQNLIPSLDLSDPELQDSVEIGKEVMGFIEAYILQLKSQYE